MIVDFSGCELSDRNLQYAGRAGENEGLYTKRNIGFLNFLKILQA